MTTELGKGTGPGKRRLAVAAAGAAVVLLLGWAASRLPAVRGLFHPADNAARAEKAPTQYLCPMHPFIVTDRQGVCPICNMSLVPKESEAPGTPAELAASLEKVSLHPSQRVAASVATQKAERREFSLDTVAMGRVAWDERKVATVSARVGGRVEKLHVDFTGTRVVAGQPLLDIYSPELVATQREYLLSLEGVSRAKDEPGAENRDLTQRLTAASRTRLKLWGITDEQIAELERSREPKTVFTVAAPAGGIVRQRLVTTGQYVTEGAPLLAIGQLSTVWVQAEVYEFESPKVSVGDPAVITAEAFPSREFHGRVSFVDPFYNPETRTVRVRVELANPGETLKPDMFVRALLRGRKGTVLAVPDTAVLVTGERAVVWVETEENVFSPRPVRLGHRSKGFWEIVSGLQEGETVVTSGGYLIDSESQLRGVAAAPAASPGTHSPEPAPIHGGHGGK